MLAFFKRAASSVANPDEGYDTLFLETNGILKFKDSVGNVRDAIVSIIGQVNIFSKAQRSAIVALEATSNTYTPDISAGNFFSFTPTANFTLANPSNMPANGITQSGSFFITQDATGSRTITFGTLYKFIGGTAPVLSTAANARDRIDYVISPSGNIQASIAKDIK